MQAVVVLAAGDRERVQPVAEAAQPVVVVAGERFLEPPHAHPLQLAGDGQRHRKSPCAVPAMARLDAGLVGVDHDLDAVANRGPHRFDHLQVLERVGQVEAELHRPVAFVEHALDVFHALGR